MSWFQFIATLRLSQQERKNVYRLGNTFKIKCAFIIRDCYFFLNTRHLSK